MVTRLLLLLGVAGLVGLHDRRHGSPGSAMTVAGPIALTETLTTLATVMVVALVCWVLAAVAVAKLRSVPGTVGRAADLGWRALVPAAIRVALVTAVGVQPLAVCGVATAVPPGQPTLSSSVLTPTYPVVSRPDTGTPPAPNRAMPTAVTVRPGDSLWLIAERHLGSQAPAERVAAEWPRWYEQNRAVIGPDPDMLAVGTRLTPPTGGRR